MKTAKILVNWYKPSGKWYAQEIMYVPPDLEAWDNQHIDWIENNQGTLQSSFYFGDWFMSVSCIDQDDEDRRFFERLVKYPRNV